MGHQSPCRSRITTIPRRCRVRIPPSTCWRQSRMHTALQLTQPSSAGGLINSPCPDGPSVVVRPPTSHEHFSQAKSSAVVEVANCIEPNFVRSFCESPFLTPPLIFSIPSTFARTRAIQRGPTLYPGIGTRRHIVGPSDHTSRIFVLCFDGTGDQFDADVRTSHHLPVGISPFTERSHQNTNVVQFCAALKKDDGDRQMAYYQVCSCDLDLRRLSQACVSHSLVSGHLASRSLYRLLRQECKNMSTWLSLTI